MYLGLSFLLTPTKASERTAVIMVCCILYHLNDIVLATDETTTTTSVCLFVLQMYSRFRVFSFDCILHTAITHMITVLEQWSFT